LLGKILRRLEAGLVDVMLGGSGVLQLLGDLAGVLRVVDDVKWDTSSAASKRGYAARKFSRNVSPLEA
jgi:hypothetical protein